VGLNTCQNRRLRNPLAFPPDQLSQNLDANRLYVVQEGGKILKSDPQRSSGGKSGRDEVGALMLLPRAFRFSDEGRNVSSAIKRNGESILLAIQRWTA
jgi:hypothetical protein